MTQVRDKRTAARIEVRLAGIVVQVAPFPAHDAPVGAIELAIEHMAVGVPVRRHRSPNARDSAESYGAGPGSASADVTRAESGAPPSRNRAHSAVVFSTYIASGAPVC